MFYLFFKAQHQEQLYIREVMPLRDFLLLGTTGSKMKRLPRMELRCLCSKPNTKRRKLCVEHSCVSVEVISLHYESFSSSLTLSFLLLPFLRFFVF
eukprot:gene2134-1309_t